MKRGLVACMLMLVVAALPLQTTAIDTNSSPDVPTAVNSPLLITGYSIKGDQLNYVQIYNQGDEIFSLNGWKIEVSIGATTQVVQELSGQLAPGSYVVAATNSVPNATYQFNYAEDANPAASMIDTVSLDASLGGEFNDRIVKPDIKSTTPHENTLPATYYFKRNISSSTGDYLTTFTAFIPDSNFQLYDDGLYTPTRISPLGIEEIYPHAPDCSPLATEQTCSDYVKLRNNGGDTVDMTKYRVRTGGFGSSATASTTAYPVNAVFPGDYVVVPINLTNSGSWVWLEDIFGSVLYDETVTAYPDSSSFEGQSWALNNSTNAWQWTRYPNPIGPNTFTDGSPVNDCAAFRFSEIGANLEKQFIEVYNSSSKPQNLRGCQLQTNRSMSDVYIFPSTQLAPGAYISVNIDSTDLTLTKTTSGTVYLLSSDGHTEVDARSYEDMSENTSLALVDGVWRQTFMVTPGTANIWQQYPACEIGFVRNKETGRCNKIATADTLKPCLSTQYRSAETNRCRNVLGATTALSPCRENQFRNPLTNRCKNTASTANSLIPCAANQERNPATNRCRLKQRTIPNAAFTVESVQDGAKAFAGWWALGGIGTLAAGYGAWEWRREVASIGSRVVQFFTSGGKE